MAQVFKTTAIGFMTGFFGLILLLVFPGLEHFGLDVLFELRGPREVPSDVLIITMDPESADVLNQPDKTEKWSRFTHAHLTETLTEEGVSVIAFDIFFEEARTPEQDRHFAEAIKSAGNVVLYSHLNEPERSRLPDKRGKPSIQLHTEEIKPPADILSQASLVSAPFPLPEEPEKLSRYWVMKPEFGDRPTFPVVAFQIHALGVYDDFLRLMKKVAPSEAYSLPKNKGEIIETKGVEKLIQDLNDIFTNKPFIAGKMLAEADKPAFLSNDRKKKQLLTSLIRMYQGDYYRYLDFYGPRGTVPTIPYHLIVKQPKETGPTRRAGDLRGKAVFVGCTTRLRPVMEDEYDFPYSKSGKIKLKGVEVAATAFANLLEGRSVQPTASGMLIAIISLWGLVLGIMCMLLSSIMAAVGATALGMAYLVGAEYQFRQAAAWFPLFIPLFVQAPLAFIGSVFWKYHVTHEEQKNIRNAFEHYLPKQEVDRLSKNMESTGQKVYGTILSTDAEKYTSLADEIADPEEFTRFMNTYYDTVFEPVMRYGGIISDVKGDEVLAIWATGKPDPNLKNRACLAALEIARAVERFNEANEDSRLPVRMGLHYGPISLGSIGAREHYEYRAVGDIVIAATRLEGLNKYLGTQILTSAEVMSQLHEFLVRELGKFLLAGKSKPIIVYELICRREEAGAEQIALCKCFSEALSAFKRKSWEEAMNRFSNSLGVHGQDGPSSFYLKLCEQNRANPPEEVWNGIVRLDKK